MESFKRNVSIIEEDAQILSILTIGEDEISKEHITGSNVVSLLSSVEEKSLENRDDIAENIIEKSSGKNFDELYEEILFETLNNIGCPRSEKSSPELLLDFARNAFKIPKEKHEELFDIAKSKEPPKVRLNVEIIKAENLMSKDSNGFSDPFVTIYVKSDPVHRYNTSVKAMTLNPVWNEYFSLPISDTPCKETLIIEVWDFDAAETIGTKMNKLFEVKGVRGLRKLMKEIAYSATTTAKDDSELIGRTEIPLNSVPASGMRDWYRLEKKLRPNRTRGSVLMHLCFSAVKDSRVAVQEHRNLLRILLIYELEYNPIEPYLWTEKYCDQAEAIITQHNIQCGLTELDCALCQWDAYTNIHEYHPLSFSLFNTILHKVIEALPTYSRDSDFFKTFWEGSKRILPSCFHIIRKIRQETFTQTPGINMLCDVLEILQKFGLLSIPVDLDLFPHSAYGWLTTPDDEVQMRNIKSILIKAVQIGATDWLNTIKESCEIENNDAVQQLTKLIQLMRFDVQRAIEYHHKHFYQIMKLKYAKILYECYQKSIVEFCKPGVIDACVNFVCLPQFDVNDVNQPTNMYDYAMVKHLFELYFSLNRFISHGTALCTAEKQAELLVYHEWFAPAVTHWLDISMLKALFLIKKAIDLDDFEPIDGHARHSSSAVDSFSIFYDIKSSWDKLDWPNIEGSYAFFGKIVDDVCRCCTFYATRMSARIAEFNNESDNSEEFKITKEWCLAISNIDYIQKSLPTFVKDLGLDIILNKLEESLSAADAERCGETMKNVIENAKDDMQNQIADLMTVAASKMIFVIRGYLFNGAESLSGELTSVEGVFIYLENSLSLLHLELDKNNFERLIDSIWNDISSVLFELVQSNLDKRRPPEFFANLRKVLQTMTSSFKYSDSPYSQTTDEILSDIEKLLNLYASETDVLIHQYYKKLYKMQKDKPQSVYGQITVKAYFSDNIELHVHVLNGKNLLPMDSNNSCDPFVKMYYTPVDRFVGIPTHKTAVQPKTLFPLFDEKFIVQLTSDQREQDDNMLVFCVKDRDFFGMSNQYLAECYLSFEDIAKANAEQIRLNLSRPEYIADADSIRALECRQLTDKKARDFIKKLKQRSY